MAAESKPTRRQFLKEAGLVVGGAVGSLALFSACRSPSTTPSPTTTSPTAPSSTAITTGPPFTTPAAETSSLPPATGFMYQPSMDQPPFIKIIGCTTVAATDRKYIPEHMWVKMVAENIVAIGITPKMAALIDFLYELSLPKEGSKLLKGDTYIYAHGAKMSLEFPNAVSGTVLQKNNNIYAEMNSVINDPYRAGWFITVGLSNLKEWDNLLTAQQYADLNAKVL